MNTSLTLKQKILIGFLILLSATIRLTSDHQSTFDSFRLHAMADSISIYGFAKWVLHPASLIGYYPLSYPSGVMYMLSGISTMTGLSMDHTILFFSVFIGVMGVLGVFVLLRYTMNFSIAFIAAMLFSLMPYYLYYTNWNASGRIMALFFSVFLLFSAAKFLSSQRKRTKALFGILILILLVYGFIYHRTAQLFTVYITALILTLIYLNFRKVYNYIEKKGIIDYFKKRYKAKPFLFVFDGLFLGAILIALKVLDLIIRGRLLINLERALNKLNAAFAALPMNVQELWWLFSLLFLLIAGMILYLIFKRWAWIETKGKIIIPWFWNLLINRTDLVFSWTAVGLVVFFFTGQFFGKSFYAPSYTEYYTSSLISGSSPLVVFINFTLNYLTTISIFTPFIVIGFISLAFRKQKTPFDILLLFIIIAFSGILLDKRYVRLFVTPLVAILISIGMHTTYRWIMEKKRLNFLKKIAIPSTIILALILVFGAFFPMIKFQLGEEEDTLYGVHSFKAAGQYMKSLDCNCSTVTTGEQVASIVIFSESGVPGSSFNIYYFVDRSLLETEQRSYRELKELFLKGVKVVEIWDLEDWILGGDYYIGRHGKLVLDNKFTDPRVRKVVEAYNERYYIHDKERKPSNYYKSIYDVKNKVYDSPTISIHDMKVGQV